MLDYDYALTAQLAPQGGVWMFENREIKLRPTCWKDIPYIIRWLGDRSIRRFFVPIVAADDRLWYLRVWFERDVEIYTIIVGSKRPVGCIALYQINETEKAAEVGLAIGSESDRNKGYGLAAMEVVKKRAKKIGLERLTARIITSNSIGISHAQKAGFREEAKIETKGLPIILLSQDL